MQSRSLKNNNEIRREDKHFRVLSLLRKNSNRTQRELADAVGISLGNLNYCLKALIATGMIEIRNFRTSNHKLSYAYQIAPSGLARKAELTAWFLERKMVEYEQLKAEITDLQHGSNRSQANDE